MTYLKIQKKKPTISSAITVTKKKEFYEMKEKYPFISIANTDIEYMKNKKDDDIVGILTGEINRMGIDKLADVWFVNQNYFEENYEIVEG